LRQRASPRSSKQRRGETGFTGAAALAEFC
jgi:hypothetical protein